MIHTIETLPIVTFVKIAETNDLTLLTDDDLTKDELSKIWDDIRDEYQKLSKNSITNKIESLKTKLFKQSTKYNLVIVCLEVLKYGKDDDVLETLKDYGYVIKGEYWSGLEKIFKQVETLRNKIKSIEDEIIKLTEKKDDVNIYEILTNLSVGLELPLKTNEITTIEYIFYKKALIKKIKQNAKK